MSKQKITSAEAVSLLAFSLVANIILTGGGKVAGQDVWISFLLVVCVMLPLAYIYRGIVLNCGDKGFFISVEETMGKPVGRLFNILIVLYSLFLGVIAFRSISEFLFIAVLTRTPLYITRLLLGMLCIWAAKSGASFIARWSRLVFPIILTIVLMLVILSIPNFDLDNFKYTLFYGPQPVLQGAWNIFTYPMVEAALLLIPFCDLEKKKDTVKIYIVALVITSLMGIIVNERNILVMGEVLAKAYYFPSYKSAGIIRLTRFFDRIEIIRGMVYIVGSFLDGTFCLYVAAQGVNSMLGIKNEEAGVTAPMGILMLTLAGSLFSQYSQLISYLQGPNGYIATAILGVLPVIIWITGKLRNGKKVKGNRG